jgi:hypothetical protein
MGEVWWEQRAATLSRATGIVSEQADCSLDDALLLLKRRASATSRDLEDMAVAIVTREVRFFPRVSAESLDYGDAVAIAPSTRRTETLRCDWQSDMEGRAWPRTVHS